MNKQVWIFQYAKEVRAKGQDHASWYVGWYDLDGKRHAESCGPGSRGRNSAEKRQRRIQSELDIGVHQPRNRKKWADFQKEYEIKVLSGLALASQVEATVSLDHFKRLVKPSLLENITTQMIDGFIAKRRQERGKNQESSISPATINKNLRQIKAALRVAHDWGYLSALPKIRMVKEPKKLPRFVTVEHFGLIYLQGCPLARFPKYPEQTCSAADWWQALVVTAYMTGMRIGEILAIKREDLDFNARQLITRAEDNKGCRDEAVPLHPVVVEHLKLFGADQQCLLFRWPHDERTLWAEFGRIQRGVGIHLACNERHKHTPACHVYGFHDFRRAFATANAPRMKPEVLQKLMRHKSYQTTLGSYINPTSQIHDAIDNMPVPDVLRVNHGRDSSVD